MVNKSEVGEPIASCGACGSANVYGMSRIVGYYSIVDNWNDAKLAEFKDRQAGDYKIEGNRGPGEEVKQILVEVV